MKNNLFKKFKDELNKLLIIKSIDRNRPWGYFITFDDKCFPLFRNIYFKTFNYNIFNKNKKFSSKLLFVKKDKRLSWQYHERRTELLKVYFGKIIVIVSDDDFEKNQTILKKGDEIKIDNKQRHRIIGIDELSIISEIWIHTFNNNPSNENDIIRIQDDYDR